MGSMDVDGLNAGYAAAVLEDYLENPEAVPTEWRALFESAPDEALRSHPGLQRLLEAAGLRNGHRNGNGNGRAAVAETPQRAPTPSAAPDDALVGGVAAMALVKAFRMHGHLEAD